MIIIIIPQSIYIMQLLKNSVPNDNNTLHNQKHITVSVTVFVSSCDK